MRTRHFIYSLHGTGALLHDIIYIMYPNSILLYYIGMFRNLALSLINNWCRFDVYTVLLTLFDACKSAPLETRTLRISACLKMNTIQDM